MPGSWVALDLSLADFLYNPGLPGQPFGQYSGGMIRPITFGSGLQIAFEHPDLRLDSLDRYTAYEVEVTYDAGTTWTRGAMESRPSVGSTSYWNDFGETIAIIGAFDATGLPVITVQMGAGTAFYAADWDSAMAAGHDALVISFTNRTIISAIRYRTLDPQRSGTATLGLSAFGYGDWPRPVFDPPPGIPDGYSAWATFDLSTAVFVDPYGQYDAVRDSIVPAGSYPAFYFPGFELDPANDYYFQFVFDSTDSRDFNGRQVYVDLVTPLDPEGGWNTGPYFWVYYDLNGSDLVGDYHLFHLDTANDDWGELANGYTLPIFNTASSGVLAEIRYAVLENGAFLPDPTFVDQHVRAASHFWGQ